jgi:hypothetical protein
MLEGVWVLVVVIVERLVGGSNRERWLDVPLSRLVVKCPIALRLKVLITAHQVIRQPHIRKLIQGLHGHVYCFLAVVLVFFTRILACLLASCIRLVVLMMMVVVPFILLFSFFF